MTTNVDTDILLKYEIVFEESISIIGIKSSLSQKQINDYILKAIEKNKPISDTDNYFYDTTEGILI
jgi:hypothetical protein